MYLLIIDYKKAFDRVQNLKLIETVHKIKVDEKDIQVIEKL